MKGEGVLVYGVLACVLLSGLMVAVTPADAAPTSGWQEAELIETDNSGNAGLPQVAMDSSGNAIAVWAQYDGRRNNIWANRYTPGSGWGAARLIEFNPGDALHPQVAMDGSGNAIAVWAQYDGRRNNIWANRYTPRAGWGTPQLIETNNSGDATYPQVVMDASGNAIAVWPQSDGARYNIWSNRYTVGSGWGTAQLIETYDSEGTGVPQVAMDGSGNAIAVWHQSAGPTRWKIWWNRYTVGAGWGTAQLMVTGSYRSASSPHVAMDPSGNAFAVWRQDNGTWVNIWANRYTPGSGWGTAQLIESNIGFGELPQVAMDDSGNAIAVWSQDAGTGTRLNIWSNRYTVGAGWGTARLIETNNTGDAMHPQVAMDASGNATAVWQQSDGIRWNIWANRYTVGSGWDTAQLIEFNNGDAMFPHVAMDASGNTITVWSQRDGTTYNIWSKRYIVPDTTPPVLTLIEPTDGTVVERSTITVSGITEPGVTLSVNGVLVYVEEDGTFSMDISLFPGENTVTVIAEDSSSNRAIVNVTVTYNDPIPGILQDILTLYGGANAIQNQNDEMNSTLNSLQERLDTLEVDIEELRGEMTTIEDEISSMDDRLTRMEDNLTALASRVSSAEGDIGAIQSDIEDLQSSFEELSSRIENVSESLHRLESEIEGAGDDVSSQKNKIDEQRKDVEGVSSELESLKSTVTGLIAGIIILFILFIVLLVRQMKGRGRDELISE